MEKSLAKRSIELANMQGRLLNGYLAGTIDDATFNRKSAEFQGEKEKVERHLDEAANGPCNAG